MSIITISHEAFGDGRQIAERVASILNYRCISREVLIKAYHEIPESMIIINPPTEGNSNPDDGIALIDLSLPHLDTAARVKFESTQKHQGKIFSDLVKSFSLTWGRRTNLVTRKTKNKTGMTKLAIKERCVA